MPVLKDISLLATCRSEGAQADIHPIRNAAVVFTDGIIRWVGEAGSVPASYAGEQEFSAGGRTVVPGLIDCHTHLGFGGWRADEFEQRLSGVSYLEIARSGGGIKRTMRQTREASDEHLLDHCRRKLREMVRLGVTTVECKTGYGLSEESELKMLHVYQRLREVQPADVVSTFLGAHIVPPEFEHDRRGYIDLLCKRLIPQIAAEGLAAFCDVFVEDTAFSIEEAREILKEGQANGMGAKLHVDQLQDGGGAALAAEVRAVSADHLEYTSGSGIDALAHAGVVAVCLPIATLYLRQQPMRAREFVDRGVPVAVATDFNPGSAPSYDLHLALMLSCTMNGLTPAEALKGATLYAARAIGRDADLGSIETGKRADFAILDVEDVNDWMYHFRPGTCVETYIRGLSVA